MGKKKRVRKPVEYSMAELKQLMDSKASELSELKSRRADLKRELDEVDRQIQLTEGRPRKKSGVAKKTARGGVSAGGRGRKKKVSRKGRRTRPRNERSAKSYAEEILRSEPKGLPLKELADRILESGYKSNAASFKTTLYQTLYNARKTGKTFDFNEKTGRWFVRS